MIMRNPKKMLQSWRTKTKHFPMKNMIMKLIRMSKALKQALVFSLYTIWKPNKSIIDLLDEDSKEQMMPQILQLAKAEEVVKVARAAKEFDPGTSLPEGENLEDSTLPAVDAPFLVNSSIPEASIENHPENTQQRTDSTLP
uniref:Uncharacterized protein n=1 Tax=Cannabis sativa TaxID=3483 RepID=A0A803PUZ7_CANSA